MTVSPAGSILGVMSTIEVPDDVAAALAAAAAERGMTVAEFIADLVTDRSERAGLDGFLGCMDSGDPRWASTDTAALRKAADSRRSA